MNASSRWQWTYRVRRWRVVQAAARWAFSGGLLLGLITIILGAFNQVSAQQVIALALPATVITIGGLINRLIPDAWTAWRRGFKQGCRIAVIVQRDSIYSNGGGAPTPTPTPIPLRRHGLPPAAL